MTRVSFLKYWSIAVGSMDAVTGLLLVFYPALVLKLLQIQPPPAESLVFLSWIGIFVMSVGLSYGLALTTRGRGEAVWVFTAMVRLMVALFLVFKIVGGTLAGPWAIVAFSDAFVAVVQIAVLRAGWWREVRR